MARAGHHLPIGDRAYVIERSMGNDARQRCGKGVSALAERCQSPQPANCRITKAAFWPPKPKLVEMAVRTGTSRALLGT